MLHYKFPSLFKRPRCLPLPPPPLLLQSPKPPQAQRITLQSVSEDPSKTSILHQAVPLTNQSSDVRYRERSLLTKKSEQLTEPPAGSGRTPTDVQSSPPPQGYGLRNRVPKYRNQPTGRRRPPM